MAAAGETIRLDIDGMHCAGCAQRAERRLKQVPGLRDVSVNFAAGSARMVLDGADLQAVTDALDAANTPARAAQARLAIEGMHCASCLGRVEAALKAVPGVLEAQVNLASETAQARYLAGLTGPAALARAVTEAGYTARPQADATEDAARRRAREVTKARRRMLIAGALTLPVFVLEMGRHVSPGMAVLIDGGIGQQTSWLVQFVLATLVLIWPGRPFYALGVPALLRAAPDMNSLVAMGTGAAWAYSVMALFAGGLLPEGSRAVYFEAAAMIVTLILVGRWLEARAKGRTGAAIARLAGLQPQTARVERAGGVADVPLDEVAVDDVLQLRPGDRVPVDAEVLEGESHIDESMITGEPAPVAKGPGDTVVGGTVNDAGALRLRATKVGSDTVLARIVDMVERAQGAKLPVQALADRVVGVFVPVVMAVALATVVAWLILGPAPVLSHALVAGVSVLIIACPCAMGLATPTSIMVGTGRAAQLGVLFRKGEALQRLEETRVVAFDKTGTLTEGRPKVTRIEPARAGDHDRVLRLAAAAEGPSEHPIARAIAAAAEGLDVPTATEFRALGGHGLTARVDGARVVIGTARLMAQEAVDLSALDPTLQQITERGQTPVFVAVDGQAAALLAVADPLKPGSRAAVDRLRARGLRVALITGDTWATARSIATDLGIDHIEAEVLPEGKLDAVRALRDRFGAVAFVGDGINDAPALAGAETGIAMGSGTDVAIEAADVVLMSGDPGGVVNALHLSRAAMRNIRQNLFWAFAYNSALVPVAAGVLYPLTGMMLSPVLAAGAMALSSVFVLGNALRLRGLRPAITPGGDDNKARAA